MKRTLTTILVLSLITSTSLLYSCSKDPDIIVQTETITVIDTIIIVDTVTVTETIIQTISDTATTYILVRHAETTGIGSNPNLSATGQARAEELKRILNKVPLNAVYSTTLNRTMQTAQPAASDHGLSIQNYDAFNPTAFIANTLVTYHEGTILIVGHSNTTPSFLNEMIGSNTYSDLQENEYDNLFIVTLFEPGRAKVVHLKYGN
jgi:broad specificity phosphatase PhoE